MYTATCLMRGSLSDNLDSYQSGAGPCGHKLLNKAIGNPAFLNDCFYKRTSFFH